MLCRLLPPACSLGMYIEKWYEAPLDTFMYLELQAVLITLRCDHQASESINMPEHRTLAVLTHFCGKEGLGIAGSHDALENPIETRYQKCTERFVELVEIKLRRNSCRKIGGVLRPVLN